MPHTKEFPECACAQTIVPEWIDPVKSAMIITLREVLSAITRFGIKEGDSVAVFGCGPVGLTYARFLHLLGRGRSLRSTLTKRNLRRQRRKGRITCFIPTPAQTRKSGKSARRAWTLCWMRSGFRASSTRGWNWSGTRKNLLLWNFRQYGRGNRLDERPL